MVRKIINLNNKNRKGLYLYIQEQDAPARYYKIRDVQEAKQMVKYYQDKYFNNAVKGTPNKYRKIKASQTETTYTNKIRKKPTLNQALGKGLTTTTINNILTATRTDIIKARKQLITPLAMNNELMKQAITDENYNKMKFRLEHRIIIKDQNGQTLKEATKYNTTTEEIQKELKQILRIGEEIEPSNNYDGTTKNLDDNGYYLKEGGKTGNIAKIDVKITFRKGK